jgi:hypothetical protein
MENRLTEAQCWELLIQLFPDGLEDSALIEELAPEGWERSPLRHVFHPTVEQVYEEAVRIHTNVQKVLPAGARMQETAPPSFEEIRREYREEPIRPREECATVVGLCLWDIFSENHEVYTAGGVLVDLGSFRGAAGFIADFRNRHGRSAEGIRRAMNYMDFYMGTAFVGRRADLVQVYELIFRRLKRLGLDWRYVHPRLGLVDFGSLDEHEESSGKPDWLGYDPSKAIARELESKRRQREVAELRESLDMAYRESVREARKNPPPRTVQAYRHVYGRWPSGWPPEETPGT